MEYEEKVESELELLELLEDLGKVIVATNRLSIKLVALFLKNLGNALTPMSQHFHRIFFMKLQCPNILS